MPGRSGARRALRACAACSPSRCGTSARRRCSWRATGSASSRFIYAVLPGGQLVFASELKALLAHPALPRRIDPCAVEDYLAYGYVPDPKTIYCDVSKLRPGHWLAWRVGQAAPREQRYWQLRFAARPELSVRRATEELLERLEEAVALRLIADVPLGAFLSGGVDSSAVVAMMSRRSAAPVNTCSIGFAERTHDETRFAQQVADAYSTRHHVGQARVQDLDVIERLPLVYDEPFADSSAIPTLQLSELARQVVTVALSGDGGDELFAGYRRHRWHLYEERARAALPRVIRRPLFGALGALYPKLDRAPRPLRLKSTLAELALDPADAYFQSVSIAADAVRRRLYAPALQRDLQGYSGAEIMRSHWRDTHGLHPLDQVQYADLMTYLPGDILTKVDRASMAHSLEVRVPLARPCPGRVGRDPAAPAAAERARQQIRAEDRARSVSAFRDSAAAQDGLRGAARGMAARPSARTRRARSGRAGVRRRWAVRHGRGPPPDRAAPERSQRSQPADLGPVHVRGLPCPGARARSGSADGRRGRIGRLRRSRSNRRAGAHAIAALG